MLEKREKVLKITTGSSALDQLLGGGIESAAITGHFKQTMHGSAVIACASCATRSLDRAAFLCYACRGFWR